jgi:signal transduction histidine kinase
LRDQFIGILSHDLRTPLGAVTAGAALLALPEDNPERRGRVAARILTSAHRMERMISDLLDLASAKLGGTIPLRRRPTNLQQVCEDAVTEIRAGHPDAVVRLQASGDLQGNWDADRLEQVVSNLVGNAIQYGSGTPISLTAQPDGDVVTLAVHNGGARIPPEVLPFIFEPLARGRAEGAPQGIGLGLFIARAIVSAHGGHIQVSSSGDAGTTFTVALPRA